MKNLDELKEKKESRSKSGVTLFVWFKFILGLLISALIVYKLAVSNLTFDFSKFDFNALLALILALFAIALSVAFYFKATDTSNLFYDNTYKFTKEISEILGRIEAGFGERLRHLDEGYSGLVNKFDYGHSEQNIKDTKEEIIIEKQKLKEDISERNKIFNSLIEKAQLEQHEKEEIRTQLKEKELEISKQNREINFLKQRLHSETAAENTDLDNLPPEIIRTLANYVKSIEQPDILLKLPTSIIGRKFKLNINELNKQEFIHLINMRIINQEGSFTIHGIRILRQIIQKYLK